MQLLSVLAIMGLAGCQGSVSATGPTAPARVGVPPPPAPAGWTTVFSDSFYAARSGVAPSPDNWFYDIGSGYGNREIGRTTNSTQNVYLDGHGHLVLKATRSGGTWWSAQIESTRDDFAAPPGGELEMTASIQQPDPANGLGYWPAFWALGSPLRAGGNWPASGELDMMEDVNALNKASQTLHDAAGASGHSLIGCRGSKCQVGYHTYSVLINRTNTKAEYLQFLMDGQVKYTVTEARVGERAWRKAIDHGFFLIFDLAMGGNYPDVACGCRSPSAATSSGVSMSVQYVAVYEKGGNSTPTAQAVETGRITGIHGLCLYNQNALNTEGNPIGARSCGSSPGQQWSVYSDQTLRVEGGCLDVGGGTGNGAEVDWYPCNGTTAQTWKHKRDGEFVNLKSGLCLTDPRGSAAARLYIETCKGSVRQHWIIRQG